MELNCNVNNLGTSENDNIIIEGKCSESREISDPEILEAMMASLKEAEEALEDTSNNEEVLVDANDNIGETFEITKMTVPPENSCEADDTFVFSDPDDESMSNVKVKGEVLKNDQKTLKPATRKRRSTRTTEIEVEAPPSKKPLGRPRKVIDKIDVVDESFSDEEDISQLSKGDTDYKPSKGKDCKKKLRVDFRKKSGKSGRSSEGFGCCQCSFVSDILGELKVHRFTVHKNCEAPSYLDMAEAAIVKIDNGNGAEELSIFKVSHNYDFTKCAPR